MKTIIALMTALLISSVLPAQEASPEKQKEASEKPEEQISDEPIVLIKTTLGDITVKLNRKKAPVSVENFLSYAKDKRYDGTIFHRVIHDFVIQGGGYMPDLSTKKTRSPIKNEADNGLKNKRGTIAMARGGDINSASNQFYINVVDNKRLDHKNEKEFGYCVFGEVVEGMDVVDKIRNVKVENRPKLAFIPVEPVIITEVSIQKF